MRVSLSASLPASTFAITSEHASCCLKGGRERRGWLSGCDATSDGGLHPQRLSGEEAAETKGLDQRNGPHGRATN